MARPAKSPHGNRVKLSVSIDPDIHAWADARVGPGKEFASMSHAIERALARLRDEEGSPSRGTRTSTSKK